MDLFLLPEQPTPHIGLAMIDIYTKYSVVVPLDSKQPLDVGTGVHEAIDAMGTAPHILYTDDEGSCNSHVLKNVSVQCRNKPYYHT